jgi:hypothetical protein
MWAALRLHGTAAARRRGGHPLARNTASGMGSSRSSGITDMLRATPDIALRPASYCLNFIPCGWYHLGKGGGSYRRFRHFLRKGNTLSEQGYERSQPEPGSAAEQGAPYPSPGQGAPGYAPQAQASLSSKGFVASLFDFGFNSFVTPKVVKVLYVLIMVVLALGGVALAVSAFAASTALGIFVLLIVAPLGFFVYLALWRIALEIFVVIFRIADDLRFIRDHGGLR